MDITEKREVVSSLENIDEATEFSKALGLNIVSLTELAEDRLVEKKKIFLLEDAKKLLHKRKTITNLKLSSLELEFDGGELDYNFDPNAFEEKNQNLIEELYDKVQSWISINTRFFEDGQHEEDGLVEQIVESFITFQYKYSKTNKYLSYGNEIKISKEEALELHYIFKGFKLFDIEDVEDKIGVVVDTIADNLDINNELSDFSEDEIFEECKLILLEQIDLQKQDKEKAQQQNKGLKMTALHYASMEGDKETIQRLFEKWEFVDIQEKNGWTPLMYARSKEIAKLFIENGANLDLQKRDGETALMIASRHSYKETVQLLLDNGANPDIQDNDGDTALSIAKFFGHTNIAQLLEQAQRQN